MIRRPLLLAALGLAVLAPTAAAAEHVPGEVVVRYADDAALPGTAHASAVVAPRTRVVRTRPGQTVDERAAELRRRPGVLSATPNLIARAAYIPNDPGRAGVPGGWQQLQWNFVGPFGVNAPAAWDHTGEAGRLGGAGVVVAVLDTGVAYADHRGTARSPDLRGNRFVEGRDFVDGDGKPDDENGHGTHVASTIAETIDNGVGVTGLAFGAQIMPVRVLDRWGEGDSAAISKGIRFAARKGADIINLSFEFGAGVTAGADPRHPRRAALRAPQGRPRRRRQRQLRARVGRLPRARRRRALGRRHDRARLPRRLLQQGPHARPRRPGRRARRGDRGRPELPPLRARGPRASCR